MTNTRNRWLYAAGAAVACAAVLVTANVALASRNPVAAPSVFEAAAPAPSAPSAPAPSAPPSQAPAIITTGIKAGAGEWVLYAKPIDEKLIPKITFGLMLGHAVEGQEPVDAVMANEAEGSDKAPGFHAVQGSMEIDQGVTPTFGYYVGPAAKITAKSGRKTLVAEQAPLDDKIQAFWFDAGNLKNLTAYDAAGKKLPNGNAAIGVG
jgi:hypothetical protein